MNKMYVSYEESHEDDVTLVSFSANISSILAPIRNTGYSQDQKTAYAVYLTSKSLKKMKHWKLCVRLILQYTKLDSMETINYGC